MHGEPVFLGVYAKEGTSTSAKRWYAWGLPDGTFMLQEIGQNDPNQPKKNLYGGKLETNILRLEADDFFAEYRVFSTSSSKQRPAFPEAGLHPKQNTAEKTNLDDLIWPVEKEQAPAGNKYQTSQSSKPAPDPAAQRAPNQKTPDQKTGTSKNVDFVQLWKTGSTAKQSSPARQGEAPAAGSKIDINLKQQDKSAKKTAGKDNVYGDPYSDKTQFRGNVESRDNVFTPGKDQSARHLPHQGYEQAKKQTQQQAYAQNKKLNRAEHAAKIEEKFRTDFSMALIRLKNKRSEAMQTLEAMIKNSGPFNEEHKFMFTDCGLALRKRNLFALASQFHQKARELSPDDEHVLFNMARVMYESGKIDKAREYLRLSLEMSPDFEEGKDFLAFIDGSGSL
jgi:tetratricopeptide (TPR) repeat protein